MMNKELTVIPEGSLLDKPANELLDDFGSGKASPGSGSAAALMGILSGKLITTVCSLTLDKVHKERQAIDKKELLENELKYMPHENEYRYIANEISNNIEPELKRLFDQDAKGFGEVIRLRKKSMRAGLIGDKPNKSHYDKISKDQLEEVTDIVFDMANQCLKLIAHGNFVFDKAYPAVKGDSGAAISSAIAGVTSCIFIINLNLKVLSRRNWAKSKKKECDALFEQLQKAQNDAFGRVGALSSEALESIQVSIDDL